MNLKSMTMAVAGLLTMVGCAEEKEKIVSPNNEVVVIETSKGKMVAEFWEGDAPKTVENFKKLAKSGYYDGTLFHRIVKGFMVQGGDPLTKDDKNAARFGTGGPGYSVNAEFNKHSHQRGVLSMARSADPNSAGSQFFICLGDASFLDGKYTAFGQLIAGENVLMNIGETPTRAGGGGEKSTPMEKVSVTKVTVVSREEALKK